MSSGAYFVVGSTANIVAHVFDFNFGQNEDSVVVGDDDTLG